MVGGSVLYSHCGGCFVAILRLTVLPLKPGMMSKNANEITMTANVNVSK